MEIKKIHGLDLSVHLTNLEIKRIVGKELTEFKCTPFNFYIFFQIAMRLKFKNEIKKGKFNV